jgi:hypothetical protein
VPGSQCCCSDAAVLLRPGCCCENPTCNSLSLTACVTDLVMQLNLPSERAECLSNILVSLENALLLLLLLEQLHPPPGCMRC